MDWRDDTFPIGSLLRNGTLVITERLDGEPSGGRYRGRHTADPSSAPPEAPLRPLLITMSSRQRVAPRALTLDLDFSHDRIAHLVWIGPFAGERGHFDVMIEEQPEGQVLAERPAMSPREAVELCCQIAAALIELHEYGWIVRGIRPELTYVDGAALTQLVPRHELFMQTATPTSHGVPPVFDRIYMAPEILANRPAVPRSDVFSVCAMLWELVAGRHPFGEAVGFPMVERIIAGEREPWTGSAPLGALLERGLATDPARRPDAAELVAELAPLRDPG